MVDRRPRLCAERLDGMSSALGLGLGVEAWHLAECGLLD